MVLIILILVWNLHFSCLSRMVWTVIDKVIFCFGQLRHGEKMVIAVALSTTRGIRMRLWTRQRSII